jgi:3'(2'), 5'-bisphosphate nucleotidase
MTEITANFVEKVVQISREAGEIVLKYYNQDNIDIEEKSDNSPVTEADKASCAFIEEELHTLSQQIPFIGEESDAINNDKLFNNKRQFWLVDPIDGTWSFIKKRGVFTINIALVKDTLPVFGVVHSPLDGYTYYNIPNEGAFRTDGIHTVSIKPKPLSKDGYDFLVSHQNINQKTTDFMHRYPVKTITPIPSAIKLCLLAEGKGDIYPRFKPTYAWDTAAGHAILREVGGEIYDSKGQILSYSNGLENPDFIAVSSTKIKVKHESK